MEMIKRIEDILNRDVRPQLALHQGDVVVESYTDGLLRIRLTGQCSGCPSASLTTENLVAEAVRAAIPEVRDVVLVTGVSESLLEEARAFLRHRPE